MEFDPLSRDIAPPRHEIESDSEEDFEDGVSRSKARVFTPPKVQVSYEAESKGKHLVIFQGEGGEAFLRTQSHLWTENGNIMVDGEQVREQC